MPAVGCAGRPVRAENIALRWGSTPLAVSLVSCRTERFLASIGCVPQGKNNARTGRRWLLFEALLSGGGHANGNRRRSAFQFRASVRLYSGDPAAPRRRFPIPTRSLSDLAPTNSLCKPACTKTGAKSNETFISSLLVRLLEASKGRNPGFHSKSAGGFAVSSLSDT